MMFDFKKNKKEDADGSNEKDTFIYLEGEASDLDPSLKGNPQYMLALGEQRYVAIKPDVRAQLDMRADHRGGRFKSPTSRCNSSRNR